MEEEAVDRDYVGREAWNLTKRIALLALLAIVVVGLHSVLRYLGAILNVCFLALASIYLVRCAYALLKRVIAFVSRLLGKLEESPRTVWLVAGVMPNALEIISACLRSPVPSVQGYIFSQLGYFLDSAGATDASGSQVRRYRGQSANG